jgi:hypothetical protein
MYIHKNMSDTKTFLLGAVTGFAACVVAVKVYNRVMSKKDE